MNKDEEWYMKNWLTRKIYMFYFLKIRHRNTLTTKRMLDIRYYGKCCQCGAWTSVDVGSPFYEAIRNCKCILCDNDKFVWYYRERSKVFEWWNPFSWRAQVFYIAHAGYGGAVLPKELWGK